MLAEDMIEGALAGVPGILALVTTGTAVRLGPKGGLPAGSPSVPAIDFERISTEPADDLTSGGDLDSVRMQVNCWSGTASGAAALAEMAREAIAPKDDIGIGTLAGKQGPARDIETRDWGVIMDFIIMEERS